MDHTGGQIDLRRGGPVVDGQHAVPGRQLERHPRPGLRQLVVALHRGRTVSDFHGIGTGRVAGMGDIERVDAALDLEGERCGAGGRAVVRHPGAARLRGDFDPASDPRHLQREVMNAAPFGGHGVRRGRVAGLPALDGVLASRDFDFQAGSPSHQRAVEKPPGFRMPRLGRGSEHRGTLAQDDVDVRACPRRLADRDGFGRESRRTDPQRQRSRQCPDAGIPHHAAAFDDLHGGGRRGLGGRDADLETPETVREVRDRGDDDRAQHDGADKTRHRTEHSPLARAGLRQLVLNFAHRRRF